MMRLLKNAVLLAGATIYLGPQSRADILVSDVRATQRPGTKLVDVSYNLSSSVGPVLVSLHVSSDGGQQFDINPRALSGDIHFDVAPGLEKSITWDAGADWGDQFSERLRIKVIANEMPPEGEGLRRYYWPNRSLSGKYTESSTWDADILNQNWGFGGPHSEINEYSNRWTGTMVPRVSGVYQFRTNSDDGMRLYLDDALDVSGWVLGAGYKYGSNHFLEAGRPYRLVIDHFEAGGGSLAVCQRLSVESATYSLVPQATLYSHSDHYWPPSGSVRVYEGQYTRGSPTEELGRASGETEHQVTLTRPMFVGQGEVTWGAWASVRGQAARFGFPDLSPGRKGNHDAASDNDPVTDVSWWDAVKWCNLRSEVEGRTPVYYTSPELGSGQILREGSPTVYANWDANGYRLPTEAEWEFLCRGGTTAAFYSGEITNPGGADPNLEEVGWYGENSQAETRPVQTKLPNGLGISDTHGNVAEWCWDWHASYPGVSLEDPQGPVAGTERVIRGGHVLSTAAECRSAHRASAPPETASGTIGFRTVCTASLLLPPGVGESPVITLDTRRSSTYSMDAEFADSLDNSAPSLTWRTTPGWLATDAIGRIYIQGRMDSAGSAYMLMRLSADGVLDADFLRGWSFTTASCMAIQDDGKILVGGRFSQLPTGERRDALVRLYENGTVDQSFDAQLDYRFGDPLVGSIAVQPDGKILIANGFDSVRGVARNHVARLLPDGRPDPSFNVSGLAEGDRVNRLTLQPDGKILIVGDFESIGGHPRKDIARLHPDGTLDLGFAVEFSHSAGVFIRTLAVLGDGRIVVMGRFDQVNGFGIEDLVRLNPDGSTDESFVPEFGDRSLFCFAPQADGKLVVGGYSPSSLSGLLRLNRDGSVDHRFDPLVLGGSVGALSLDAKGRILMGGGFSDVNGVAQQFPIARLGNDPALDEIDVPDAGRIVWRRGGTAPVVRPPLFRISADGGQTWAQLGYGSRIEGGWALEGLNLPPAALVLAVGKVSLTASSYGSEGQAASRVEFAGLVPDVVVVGPDGEDLPGGGTSTSGSVLLGSSVENGFQVLNAGRAPLNGISISVGGEHGRDFTVTERPASALPPGEGSALRVKFSPTGEGLRRASLSIQSNDPDEPSLVINLVGTGVVPGNLYAEFSPQYDGEVYAVAEQPDGKLVVGGGFGMVDGLARNGVARLIDDGTVEGTDTFDVGAGANNSVIDVAVQEDGKILLAGLFSEVDGEPRNGVARLLPDGSVEGLPTFDVGAGADGIVSGLVVQRDGKILISGLFDTVDGEPRSRIARLLPDGRVEGLDTFNPGAGADGWVTSVALQDDGKIVLGGSFSNVNGQPRAGIARLLSDGRVEGSDTFNVGAGADGQVYCIATQPDGKILMGGSFASVNGQPRSGIARLLPDGSIEGLDTFAIGAGVNGVVHSISLQTDGKILIGGTFTEFDGSPRSRIARLLPDGTLEAGEAFDLGGGADGAINCLSIQGDGKIVIGGLFTAFDGTSVGRLARLANDPASEELTVRSSSQVAWDRAGSSPEVGKARFEVSMDGGGSWFPLGDGQRTADGWELGGLSLPSTGMLRVLGSTRGGYAGGSSGLVEARTTFVNRPTILTQDAAEVTAVSATLVATVIPNGAATVFFEYGLNTNYGTSTIERQISGANPVEVAIPVSGLQPNRTYHFRMVASNAAGLSNGDDAAFMTTVDRPVVATAAPSDVSESGATLQGAVNPNGRETTVYFQYGESPLYGSTTAEVIIPAGATVVDVGIPITGLRAGRTYHYRVVASNAGGTAIGADESFKAEAGAGDPTDVPTVTTGAASEISTMAATLAGTANPNGGLTNAYFEYGLTTAYGSSTTAQGLDSGTIPANVSLRAEGLTPGSVYHYRLVATNSLGTARGEDATFTTRYLPPIVTTGDAEAASTTSTLVRGSVNANGTPTQVSFEYGTDGITFPSSVVAVPAEVSGSNETDVVAELINLSQGVTYFYRARAVSSGGVSLGDVRTFTVDILSGLDQVYPNPPPSSLGEITVSINPPVSGAAWRLVGEQRWRLPGESALGLVAGNREVEFLPISGFLQPVQEGVGVVAGGRVSIERIYYETPGNAMGSLSVVLKPDDLAGEEVIERRIQWRLLGEEDTSWRDSGTSLTGLVPGSYLVECKPVEGRVTPPLGRVVVQEGQEAFVTLTYFLADDPVGTGPIVLDFATVSSDDSLPYAWVGQLRSDVGLSTGFVVKPRVVATAGHVVFDDGTLAPVTGLQWLLQRERDRFEPEPVVPRGFYLFTGYSAQREAEGTPGASSPQSQQLDVAALYFNQDVGRNGYSGFLASDLPENEFLLSDAQKMLVGYPVDGIPEDNVGRMHATPPMNVSFTKGFGRTYATTDIWSSGGNSGGPLFVQYEGGRYFPAAVYLGGTGQTVVRSIDSGVIDLFNRAEVSGGGGGNNTGGGITHTSVIDLGVADSPGAVEVILEPEAARLAGAVWRFKEGAWRGSGARLLGLREGPYVLEVSPVAGFKFPTQVTVEVVGGQLKRFTYTYEPGRTALEEWRLAQFGTAANEGDAADLADPDGDGLKNIVEWGFGLNGLVWEASPVSTRLNERGNLEIRFPRLQGADQPNYDILVGEDLITWLPAAEDASLVGVEALGGGTELVTYEYTGGVGASGRLFFVVAVSE